MGDFHAIRAKPVPFENMTLNDIRLPDLMAECARQMFHAT